MHGPRENCWLVDSAADVHVCNDKRLMTEYRERPTRVGGSKSNGLSPGRGKVKLRLSLKDGSEGLMLNLFDALYLPNSPGNLVSLGRLNDSGIFYNNEDEKLYIPREISTGTGTSVTVEQEVIMMIQGFSMVTLASIISPRDVRKCSVWSFPNS